MAITPLPLYKVPKLLWVSKGRSPRGWGRTQVDAVGERGGQAGGQHVLHHAEALAAKIFLLLLLLVVLGVRPHHIVQLRGPPRSSLGVPPQVGSPPRGLVCPLLTCTSAPSPSPAANLAASWQRLGSSSIAVSVGRPGGVRGLPCVSRTPKSCTCAWHPKTLCCLCPASPDPAPACFAPPHPAPLRWHPIIPHPITLHPITLHPSLLCPHTLHPQTPHPCAGHPQALHPQTLHPAPRNPAPFCRLPPNPAPPNTPSFSTLTLCTPKPCAPRPGTPKPCALHPQTLRPFSLHPHAVRPQTPHPRAPHPQALHWAPQTPHPVPPAPCPRYRHPGPAAALGPAGAEPPPLPLSDGAGGTGGV